MKTAIKHAFAALLLLAVSVLFCMSAFAGTTSDGRFEFEYSSSTGEIKITEYKGSDTSLVIPAQIQGKYVTRIGYKTFEEANSLKQVSFEQGSRVNAIEWAAFLNCKNLTSITLPDSLRDIGDAAFYGCSSLKSIAIPEGVTCINESWGMATIGGVFEGCSSLQSVSIPSTVTKIGWNAFQGCSSLKQITLPAGLTTIGTAAFQDTGLTSVTIPSGVTELHAYAFADCSALTQVVLPSTLKRLDTACFARCISLTSINIPVNLTGIEREVFSGCSSLATLTFGEEIPYTGSNLFTDCPRLTVRVVAGSKIEEYCINNNIPYYIYASSISGATIDGIEDKTYTGSSITQKMSVTCSGDKLTEGVHYKTEYANNINVGEATVKITGIGNYVGTVSKTFRIARADLSGAVVKVSTPTVKYSAASQKPSVTVTLNGVTVSPSQYNVYYSYNFYVGTANITVSGTNNYQNSAKTTFTIVPKTTSRLKLKAGSRSIKVVWKKNDIQTSGYQIQIARNKKFTSGKKTKTVKNNQTTSLTIKKLAANKIYYVRVRTFQTVNGKKYYSAWSTVKSIRTKK